MPNRLLVVDDDSGVRDTLCLVLPAMGFDVWTAAGLSEAAEVLRIEPPDLVLLDMNLPDGDGIDLLEDILRSRPDLPVIMMSGDRDAEREQKARRLGARAFLTKPFDLEYLAASISSMLPVCYPDREKKSRTIVTRP